MKEILYNKVQVGLEGDDIILEIRIHNTNLGDWNQLVRTIEKKYTIECFGVKKKPINEIVIDESFFPHPPDYENNEFEIYFSYFNLRIVLYELGSIEIFTDSVVRLSKEELNPLFDFIEYLGDNLHKEIGVYVESTTKPIFTFSSGEWKL